MQMNGKPQSRPVIQVWIDDQGRTQCKGANINRTLFNGMMQDAIHKMNVQFDKQDSQVVEEAPPGFLGREG